MQLRFPIPDIPRSRLVRVRNLTPMAHFRCTKMGPGATLSDVLTIKGTYRLASGPLRLTEERPRPLLVDRVWEPAVAERSSLREAGEVVLTKPGTDLYLSGHARTPDGQPRPSWSAGVAVYAGAAGGGLLASHTLRVHGPREWRRGAMTGWLLSDPVPTASVPIRYELAYGGALIDREATQVAGAPRYRSYRPNPSGRGVLDEASHPRGEPLSAPQWELPTHPVTVPNHAAPLAGFGPVARPWACRVGFAGTYDADWRAEAERARQEGRLVDYPQDFDPRFFQCAPEALRFTGHLRGDEHIGLEGLVEGHERLLFQLPRVAIRVRFRGAQPSWSEQAAPLDTIHIDLDRQRVSLVWRLRFDLRLGTRGVVVSGLRLD